MQITIQWVYLSQAAEVFLSQQFKKKKNQWQTMKTGEQGNIISDDQHVREHAGARLGGVFTGKMQLFLSDEL